MLCQLFSLFPMIFHYSNQINNIWYTYALRKTLLYIFKKSQMNLKFLVFSILLIIVSCKKLMLIQQTFRHGARYPVFPEKLDHSDIALQTNNVGQLTTQGKNMHYLLGKIIYEKYWDQLFKGTQYENSYHQSQFFVKSTDRNRTIESAQSHLFGLLESLPKLQLNKSNYQFSLPAWNVIEEKNVSNVWQVFTSGPTFHPTAIHTEKRGASVCNGGDFLINYDEDSCPNQIYWSSQNLNSDFHQETMRNPKIKQAIKVLQAAIGRQIQFQDIYKWKDSYTCLKYLGLPYLTIFQDPNYSKIYDFLQTYATYLYYYSQPAQIRAVSTNYVRKTLQNFKGKINGTFTPSIVIYSGHDTTIAMIFAAMQFTTLQCLKDHYLNGASNDDTCIWEYPPYSANLIFQLWNNNGQYTIRMLYKGQLKKIPICDYKTQCTLQQFQNWVEQFAVNDVPSACGYVGKTKTFYAVVFLLFSIIIIMIFYILYLHAKINKIDSVGRAKKMGYVQNFQQKHHQQQLKP